MFPYCPVWLPRHPGPFSQNYQANHGRDRSIVPVNTRPSRGHLGVWTGHDSSLWISPVSGGLLDQESGHKLSLYADYAVDLDLTVSPPSAYPACSFFHLQASSHRLPAEVCASRPHTPSPLALGEILPDIAAMRRETGWEGRGRGSLVVQSAPLRPIFLASCQGQVHSQPCLVPLATGPILLSRRSTHTRLEQNGSSCQDAHITVHAALARLLRVQPHRPPLPQCLLLCASVDVFLFIQSRFPSNNTTHLCMVAVP